MRKPDGQTRLLAGSANYEDGGANGSLVRYFDFGLKAVQDRLPGWEVSVGPLAAADVDGDGVLDLFAGGRVVPGRYPEAADSVLFRGAGAQFKLDEQNTPALARVGLVSGAVFSDLDGDGFPELILACEWGPVKVFRNDHGRLRDATTELGLSKYAGWWNGVATGDFDGDGRLDIVASNWGRNTRYQSHRPQPARVYFGPWRGNGAMDLLEAYYDGRMKKDVPWCSYTTARALPWVAEGFATAASFSEAGIAEILGERAGVAQVLAADWPETTLFLNRGDHFEAKVLPPEAQFSPAFGISVADMDGDGREDIFLSQNFFATDGDTPRSDAGRGLWLAGDGQGGFRPVPGPESGVRVYGEQRGCAVCDYDGDGRVDLVVTQNGAETKLYHNERARPGLRVRLRGPAGNPHGVGATLRLGTDKKLGPAREVQAGSGYWSQNSVVQVLAAPQPATQLQVRWPGGKTTTANFPAGASEIAVDASGAVQVLR